MNLENLSLCVTSCEAYLLRVECFPTKRTDSNKVQNHKWSPQRRLISADWEKKNFSEIKSLPFDVTSMSSQGIIRTGSRI